MTTLILADLNESETERFHAAHLPFSAAGRDERIGRYIATFWSDASRSFAALGWTRAVMELDGNQIIARVPRQNFETFLRRELEESKTDFELRACIGGEGHVEIYVHPLNQNGGTTPTLVVKGNTLSVAPRNYSPGW